MKGGDTHHYTTEEHARFALITRPKSLNLAVDSLNSGLFFFLQYLISAVFESISVSYCKKKSFIRSINLSKKEEKKKYIFPIKILMYPFLPCGESKPVLPHDRWGCSPHYYRREYLCFLMHLFVHSVCQSISLSVCGSVGLSICRSVGLSDKSVSLSICMSEHPLSRN